MKIDNSIEYEFFYNGPFSQWHYSPFTESGLKFNCAEQYMMYHKAKLFNDTKSITKIMASDSPAVQKALGRKVNNFNVEKWNNIARNIVYRGNLLKFNNNKDLKDILLSTAPKVLVEASPYDTIWGIGLDESEAIITPVINWKGKNWLGLVLTELRNNYIMSN